MASLDEVKYGSIITIFVIIYTNGCCIKIEDKSNFILIKSVYLFLCLDLKSFELPDKGQSY